MKWLKMFDRHDYLILFGGMSVFYGVYRLSPSIAFIIAGLFAAVIGLDGARKGGDN